MTEPEKPLPPTKEELQEDDYMRQGAKWGTIAGFMMASVVMGANSPLGFYSGSVTLLFIVFIGGGLLGGLTLGSLMARQWNDDAE
jgi:hypothetical protein